MEIAPGVHQVTVGKSAYMGVYPPNVFIVVGKRAAALVDGGYNRSDDVKARVDYLSNLGNPKIAAIVITHRHTDHAGGAGPLHKATGGVIMCAPQEKEPLEMGLEGAKVGKVVADGETLDLGGATLEFIHTPGHTLGSLSVLHKEQGLLFTGDHILGTGTTVVNPDEGDMALYIKSLEKLLNYDVKVICPGHGPLVRDAKAKIRELIQHRLEREQQILTLLKAGRRTVEDFLKGIYPELDSRLHPMARNQIKTHLVKLQREGKVKSTDGGAAFALVD